MRSSFVTALFLVVILFASCSPTKNASVTKAETPAETDETTIKDGSSFEKAIVVNSVREEYRYVREVCPECRFKMQSLATDKKKYYDILHFQKGDNEVIYYFDINSFFGKGF